MLFPLTKNSHKKMQYLYIRRFLIMFFNYEINEGSFTHVGFLMMFFKPLYFDKDRSFRRAPFPSLLMLG